VISDQCYFTSQCYFAVSKRLPINVVLLSPTKKCYFTPPDYRCLFSTSLTCINRQLTAIWQNALAVLRAGLKPMQLHWAPRLWGPAP